MHPRNPYKRSPDFHSLAEFFPSLKPYLSLCPSGKHTLDFRDPGAQKALTQALLKRDFNITISLPEHRLCPPVPNRLNYVLWVQDILFPYDGITPDKEIKGLDIGTGASAIYPLLACSLPDAERWTFVGTEIDPLSAGSASRNIESNNLQSRVTIWPIQKFSKAALPLTEEDPKYIPILAPLVNDLESRFDFTMCNPPFYGSTSEIENSAKAKDLPPIAICTGAETEMITPGGETAFVLQMLQESAQDDVQGRCRWYTSMLGKLGSVGEVVGELRRLNIDNYALTQFIQGTTRRWAVAWSFEDERLPDIVARPPSSSLSSYLPAPTTLRQTFSIVRQTNNSQAPEVVHLKLALSRVLNGIGNVVFHPVRTDSQDPADDESWKFNVTAYENTWSRAARRKRKRSISPLGGRVKKTTQVDRTSSQTTMPLRDEKDPTLDLPHRPALQCCISVLATPSEYFAHANHNPRPVTLEAQWMKGKDRSTFEGFWSHVCRKVIEKLEELGSLTGEGGPPTAG